MILTSYFSAMKDFPENYIPISIALYQPLWYNGRTFPLLAPSRYIYGKWRNREKNRYTEDDYHYDYMNTVIGRWPPDYVEAELHSRVGVDNFPVLVCYESEGFCHRHIVREWFNFHGIECYELEFKGEKTI